ncbi:NmrA/HSCARG family protein [Pyxidicoccus parkwayensis]|uniref:NmrA/HSCARG family protein n=1 Tax=Pyxidicoccus parkwayensis TaxID=2813578 RepID=A0ABX7NTY8_9BACT|nr:NmrA/HSCARG family protein [Pyxidicoccus parkwaysis]QSQ21891.1 NmrA/HSCARG family protein [Pyxidicoccus parkwaysis]
MSQADKVIVVFGATGRQGSAAAKHLQASGWRVRAPVRDTRSAGAQALARSGVEVVPGDMNDCASLDSAMRGAHGVFSVQPGAGDVGFGVTLDDEVRMGKGVADAAKAAGVRHLVYTSVGGAERNTGIGHFETKWTIEKHIRSIGVPATVFRPNAFMEILTWKDFGIPQGVLSFFSAPESPLQLIAVDDIGRFVALAFGSPETYVGQSLELAGDALTGTQLAAAISRATNRSIPYVRLPGDVLRQNSTLERIARFTDEDGGRADITALRERHPGLMTFDTWLDRTGRALFETLLRQP